MRAFIKTKYGGPEVLDLAEVDKPSPKENELLVKVMANSANPADWHILRGQPFFARFSTGLLKPKNPIPGADFAGIVEATGSKVTQFQPGDRVFGETLMGGAFAAYTCVKEDECARMPDSSTFEEMAAVPIAGITALQALLTHGKLRSGESVLINGASGGVGHLAVQIAHAYGGRVTAVCSARNRDFVRSLGAEQVIAYDQENIHLHKNKYDLVLDNHGNLSFKDFKRMGHRGVLVGFTTLRHMISVLINKSFSKFPLIQFTAEANVKDLMILADMIHQKKIKIHIDKIYSYKNIPEAIGYIEAQRTKGKVVMVWK